MDHNTSLGTKGISLGEWRHQTMPIRRKRLSDITNLSVCDFGDGFASESQENGMAGSSVLVNECTSKLFKENNALMRALAEKNTEVQNLRLIVAKLNQQNMQLAQAHSQMIAELNLSKDRLKATQHELGCTSTALKVKTQELMEQKNKLKQNMRMQNIATVEEEHIKPVEYATALSSQVASHKKTCPPNRKRPQRSQSLALISIKKSNHVNSGEENQRHSVRRKSTNNSKVELRLPPTEDLFEIDDAKLPMRKGGEGSSDELKFFTPIKLIKAEEGNDGEAVQSLLKRTSLGRPLRRAAEKVNCYKEMPLNVKLRRPE